MDGVKQEAFEDLKVAMSTAPVLKQPVTLKCLMVYDVSILK